MNQIKQGQFMKRFAGLPDGETGMRRGRGLMAYMQGHAAHRRAGSLMFSALLFSLTAMAGAGMPVHAEETEKTVTLRVCNWEEYIDEETGIRRRPSIFRMARSSEKIPWCRILRTGMRRPMA